MILKSDKVLHFAASFIIVALVALTLYGVADLPKVMSIVCALGVAFICGVGKELYDKFIRKTGFDTSDLIADAIGAVLAALFTIGM